MSEYRVIACLAMVTVELPLCCSLRLLSSLDDNATGSEGEYDELEERDSIWQVELTSGDDSSDGLRDATEEAMCQKQAAKFAEVTVDAPCPILEPRFTPSESEDIVQFLHFRCDRYLPLRRCYEVIPAGVGVDARLMPSLESDWRNHSRLLWPSEGLLDWTGMRDRVPGTVGPPVPSHGWEWLANRTFGNCWNCWNVPDEQAKRIDSERMYIKKQLGVVPLADIRTMLDLGGGAGNIAAVLKKAYNTTVVSDNGDFGAPFLETIAARGLLSLSFDLHKRMPFVDSAFDAVHSRTTGVGDIETFLIENDRLIRPGGYIIMHRQCLRNHEAVETMRRVAARLSLRDKRFKVESMGGCTAVVTAIYHKPRARRQSPVRRIKAVANAKGCDSFECLCKERSTVWLLEWDKVGTCTRDAEATWHWISQHCVHRGIQLPKRPRCAAVRKHLPLGKAHIATQPCVLFSTLMQMDLPLNTDAMRTILDIEGDGTLVSDLQVAHGMQGMVLSSELHKLNAVASRGMVGLQSSLSMRQPFGSGAFDMVHVCADFLDRAFRSHSRQQALLEESLRGSIGGDLSAPSPLPDLQEFIYEIDRLVRPGGYVVVSFDEPTAGVPEIFHGTVMKLGWKLRTEMAKGFAFVRPSQQSEQPKRPGP